MYILLFLISVDYKDKTGLILAEIPEDSRSCVKARYTLGFLGFLGFALVYAMRVNLSVAIVSMVNNTEIPDTEKNTTDVCPINPVINGSIIPPPVSNFSI